jgi:hypothetical protein
MAVRKSAQEDQSDALETTSDLIEQRVGAFAEQLGSFVGTVQAKAEGWLDRKALSKEVGRVRDLAADLLDQLNREGTLPRRTGT